MKTKFCKQKAHSKHATPAVYHIYRTNSPGSRMGLHVCAWRANALADGAEGSDPSPDPSPNLNPTPNHNCHPNPNTNPSSQPNPDPGPGPGPDHGPNPHPNPHPNPYPNLSAHLTEGPRSDFMPFLDILDDLIGHIWRVGSQVK